MNGMIAVGAGLLTAFTLALGAACFGMAVSHWYSLNQRVPAEELARYRLIPPKWDRTISLVYAGYVLVRIVNGFGDPKPFTYGVERLLGRVATARLDIALLCLICVAFCGCPLAWSMRILRQPAGACSAPLRQMAKIAFRLGGGAMLALVFLLLEILWRRSHAS